MDATCFDALTHALASGATRRAAVRALGAALGAGVLLPVGANDTTGKKKRRKKPLPLNQFGCLNVGAKCRGKSTLCCSGVCTGRKPKKGKRDQRKCVAHNAAGCAPEINFCVAPPSAAFCNPVVPHAVCMVTTGRGNFCGNRAGTSDENNCRLCARDKDCEALGFPLGSACVMLAGTNCGSNCATTGARACVPPGA